ncbi:MAG: hypothetical protein GF346_06850 [Candidatus Eisenbacteria bacterium]|nr:hypothetical protein [Candidatus Latescibacterota bacterium]MBD3302147.1 hypothetical protein [Candidatus Eisenbacteria bacterium]
MGFHLPETIEGKRGRANPEGLRIAGFLTLLLGFLTVPLAAAPLEEALQDLDALEEARAEIFAKADSVGRAIAVLPDGADEEIGRLLQDAERLAERARSLDVEILLARQRCRSLAMRELERLESAADPESLAREGEVLDLLEDRLADRWGIEPVFVEPDSLDGYETLLDKQAYLADLRDRIALLSRGLTRRIDSVRREEALRRASERFADESAFLDEGGRIGSDGRAPLRGIPDEDPPDDGHARSLPTGGAGNDPDAVPADAFGAEWPDQDRLDALEAARRKLERDLSRVADALRETEDLLEQYENPGS